MKMYDIPRNKKRGQNFWGIEKKGWVYLFPALLLYFALSLILPIPIPHRIAFFLFLAGVTSYLLQTDEKTGKFNGWYLYRIALWVFRLKKIHVKWGLEHESKKSIKRFERHDEK